MVRVALFLTMAAFSPPAFAEKPILDVRVVSADQRSGCKYLGLISVRKALGPNKQKGAFNKAFKEVRALGGNSLFLISSTLDWAEGAQLTGEALLCDDLNGRAQNPDNVKVQE